MQKVLVKQHKKESYQNEKQMLLKLIAILQPPW